MSDTHLYLRIGRTLISLITVEVRINVEGGKSFKINKRAGVKPSSIIGYEILNSETIAF